MVSSTQRSASDVKTKARSHREQETKRFAHWNSNLYKGTFEEPLGEPFESISLTVNPKELIYLHCATIHFWLFP